MRKIINVILAVCFVMSSCLPINAQQVSEMKEVIIPDGTEFSAVTIEPISSETAVAGTTIKFEVYEDVKIDGITVIKEGAIIKGYVSEAEESGKGGRRGKLGISIESTTTVDNQPIKLRSVKQQEGEDKRVAVFWTGFLIGPFALFRHGDEAVIVRWTPKIGQSCKV